MKSLNKLSAKYLQLSLKGRAIWIAFFCLIYIFIFATPPFTTLLHPEANYYWSHINKQMDHPLQPIILEDPAAHPAKLSLRLLVPVIGHIIPSDNIQVRFFVVILLKSFLGFLFFYYIFQFFYKRITLQWVPELLTISWVTLYCGKAFITDFMWFDEFAFFFILLSLISRNTIIVFLSVIAACFTDERSFFSLLFVIIFRLYEYVEVQLDSGNFTVGNFFKNIRFNRPLINLLIIPAAMAVSVGIRIYLQKYHGLGVQADNSAIIFLDYLRNGNMDYLIIGIFVTFKFLWLLIIWFFYKFFKISKLFFLFTFLAFILILIVSLSVWDLSRSLNYAFPLLFFTYYLLTKTMQQNNPAFQKSFFIVIAVIVIGNFICPSIMVADGVDMHHNILMKFLDHK
ncbi:MAG: hypothetical protein V4556_12000 [Bacteroidota bacterium]